MSEEVGSGDGLDGERKVNGAFAFGSSVEAFLTRSRSLETFTHNTYSFHCNSQMRLFEIKEVIRKIFFWLSKQVSRQVDLQSGLRAMLRLDASRSRTRCAD